LSMLLLVSDFGYGQVRHDERHIEVSLRLIGHQLLLKAGDSTSRVLPVRKIDDSYLLTFQSELSIKPDRLVSLMDSVVRENELAMTYLVEVLECEKREVVYSFEMGHADRVDIIPCRGRDLPEDCYIISFTILEHALPLNPVTPATGNIASAPPTGIMPLAISGALLVLITALWLWFRQKGNQANPEIISLGHFHFDPRNMVLVQGNTSTELTAKECDLLLLLYQSANETLERDYILHEVWGDEGDYIGRTLDVFVSKLRKKLGGDKDLRIVNVRGVGYKLVIN